MFAGKSIAKWALAFVLVPVYAKAGTKPIPIEFTVLDDTGAPVPDATITIQAPGMDALRLATDRKGHAGFTLRTGPPYHVRVEKPGYFQTDVDQSDASQTNLQLVLTHSQMLMQSVNVKADTGGIDPQELADKTTMNVSAVNNIPYPEDRDIRQLLQYFPDVVQDPGGRQHVAGSSAGSVLDMLDGFDIRSPFNGDLSMRFSADAIRSIEQEATRYPVEFGRNTGGVIAFRTGTGDDKLRFNVTDFVPQFQELNGIRFENFVPRVTFSGPVRRNNAWFFNGTEAELNVNFVPQLPHSQQTDTTVRGSNLLRFQWDLDPATVVKTGLLFNDYHEPFVGLSPGVPQESAEKENTIAWFPYVRMQHRFGGSLLDMGFGLVRFSFGQHPYPGASYAVVPGGRSGANFQTDYNLSQSVQSNAVYYFQPRRWMGVHDLKAGFDLDQLRFTDTMELKPIQYFRWDRSLLRTSTFPASPTYTRHNLATGVFVEDHWSTGNRLLMEPGVRLDWDEITRRPTLSPRFAVALVPAPAKGMTKIAAGIGIYYEHTQLDYLARALNGVRYDTYYSNYAMTPVGPPMVTTFTYDQNSLKQPYAVNWSVGLEQQLPGQVFLKVNYISKLVKNEFTYANTSASAPLSGTYVLTNLRTDRDTEFEIDATKTFRDGYTLFGAYTHSSARTNAVIDYVPWLSELGPQQSGPLPWDVPNRVISWGWLPLPTARLKKNWSYVYSMSWRTGFPFTAIDANNQVFGAANGYRYPNYLNFSPGLEVKFHVRGYHLAMRTVVENATGAADPAYVQNNIDSPVFGHFFQSPGRAFTVRIRLLDTTHHSGIFQ